MTVNELIKALKGQPGDSQVSVWLPGSTVILSNVFTYRGQTRIEGNIAPGSALDDGVWPNWGDSPNGFDGPGGAE